MPENLSDWLGDNAWVIWVSLSALLGIAEILTLDLTLIMLATGALAGAGVALIAPGLWWLQILVAAVVSLAMLGLLRPTLLRHVRNMPGYRSSYEKMVGSSGTAESEITSQPTGEVKIDGQTWTARSFDEAMVIEAGTEVEVYAIEGAIAVVYPKHGELP